MRKLFVGFLLSLALVSSGWSASQDFKGTINGNTITAGTGTVTVTSTNVLTVDETSAMSSKAPKDGPTFTGIGTFSGDVTIGKGGGTTVLTIGDTSVTGAGFINMVTSAAYKNWQISSNQYVIGLSFTPSTAVGGITFTTPVLDILPSGLAVTGALSVTAPITMKGYTVASLPAGTIGMTAYVTDALAPTFLATIVGGGAVVTPVFFNGAGWVGF